MCTQQTAQLCINHEIPREEGAWFIFLWYEQNTVMARARSHGLRTALCCLLSAAALNIKDDKVSGIALRRFVF